MEGPLPEICTSSPPTLYVRQRVIERCKTNSSNTDDFKVCTGPDAFLAELDKFLNLLTNWEQYVSPLAQRMLPLSPASSYAHRGCD